MLITPTLMMQILPQLVPPLSQVTGMLIGGKKGRDIASRGALLGTALGLADLGKSFLSPKIGSELSKSTVEGLSKSDGGIMPRLLDKGLAGDLGKQSIFSKELGLNTMQIRPSGISNSLGKDIPTLHNPFDLF